MEDRKVGDYSSTVYSWYPSVGGWSKDNGGSKIADEECPLDPGVGFAIYNNVKMNASGDQSTKPSDPVSPIHLLCSGEVDLVNQNVIPAGWAVSGNATPISLYLKDIKPMLTSGKDLTIGGKVTIQLMEDRKVGDYSSTVYSWYPSVGGWSKDNGGSKIADEECPLDPGVGFAIYNNVKMNASGDQSTKPSDPVSPIYLNVVKDIVK